MTLKSKQPKRMELTAMTNRITLSKCLLVINLLRGVGHTKDGQLPRVCAQQRPNLIASLRTGLLVARPKHVDVRVTPRSLLTAVAESEA
jgi:hypothetical protein